MLALGNLVACGYQCGDGALDNIFVNADAPVGSAVSPTKAAALEEEPLEIACSS